MTTKLGRMITYFDGHLPFDRMDLQNDVTNKIHFISSTTAPMANKHGSIVNYLVGFYQCSHLPP